MADAACIKKILRFNLMFAHMHTHTEGADVDSNNDCDINLTIFRFLESIDYLIAI